MFKFPSLLVFSAGIKLNRFLLKLKNMINMTRPLITKFYVFAV